MRQDWTVRFKNDASNYVEEFKCSIHAAISIAEQYKLTPLEDGPIFHVIIVDESKYVEVITVNG